MIGGKDLISIPLLIYEICDIEVTTFDLLFDCYPRRTNQKQGFLFDSAAAASHAAEEVVPDTKHKVVFGSLHYTCVLLFGLFELFAFDFGGVIKLSHLPWRLARLYFPLLRHFNMHLFGCVVVLALCDPDCNVVVVQTNPLHLK